MIGTIFNTAMIFCGSLLGTLFKKGMASKYHDILMQGLGLAVIALGLNTTIQHMPNSRYPVLFILSLAIGGVVGTFWTLKADSQALLKNTRTDKRPKEFQPEFCFFASGLCQSWDRSMPH